MTEVRDTTDAAIATYYYDPFGRRLSKNVNGVQTYYLYADEGLIAEYDSTGTEIRSYGYLPGTTNSVAPLYTKENSQYYWYHNDHIGTPQQLMDDTGTLAWEAKYTSFGKAAIVTETITNNFRLPGHYYDEETGLHYNGNRYYDPDTGRYLRTDPLGIDGGLNLYVYAMNSPLMFIDPDGLIARDAWDYTKRSGDQLIRGNYSDEVTLLGTGAQIGTGLLGLDLPGDIRDITYDLTNWEWSWGHAGQTLLDTASVLPLVGALKYADETSTLIKNVDKVDDIADASTSAGKLADAGEDFYVGTYSKSKYWNKKTGLNETHTPHHVVQDAVSDTTHGKGITINIKKDIHANLETTGSSKRQLDNLRQHLAADVIELRNAGYDRSTVNRQLQELIRQNKATGGF